MSADAALDIVRREARWFEPTSDGLGPLLDAIADARVVLIGEASHGTHEFYQVRAELTKALILHIDETSALEPLELWAYHDADLPETYPSGM